MKPRGLRPPPLAQVARSAARRQVIVAIDNRDALIDIYREQIQTLELELRRSRARVEAAKEQTRPRMAPMKGQGCHKPGVSSRKKKKEGNSQRLL